MVEEFPFVDCVITPVERVLADHMIVLRLEGGLIVFLVKPGSGERNIVRDGVRFQHARDISEFIASFPTPAGIYLGRVDSAGTTNPIDPFPPGPSGKQVGVSGGEQDYIFRNGAAFTIPASGNSYFQTALPTLVAGNYMLSFTAINNQDSVIGGANSYGTAMTLQWIFTIASDGTFSSISAF